MHTLDNENLPWVSEIIPIACWRTAYQISALETRKTAMSIVPDKAEAVADSERAPLHRFRGGT